MNSPAPVTCPTTCWAVKPAGKSPSRTFWGILWHHRMPPSSCWAILTRRFHSKLSSASKWRSSVPVRLPETPSGDRTATGGTSRPGAKDRSIRRCRPTLWPAWLRICSLHHRPLETAHDASIDFFSGPGEGLDTEMTPSMSAGRNFTSRMNGREYCRFQPLHRPAGASRQTVQLRDYLPG